MKRSFFSVAIIKNKQLKNRFTKAKRELADFFGCEIADPLVILLNSRQEIDNALGRKSENWLVAWVNRSGIIFILKPEVYTKESDHKDPRRYWLTVKHELAHLFFYKLSDHKNQPKWLNEGLASYLAGQKQPLPDRKKAFKVFSNFSSNSDRSVYIIGYFWVKLLIEKFGKDKMLKLIKSLNKVNNQREFAQVFKKIYKVDFNRAGLCKLYKDV